MALSEEPPLCGKEADKFLLALPQHRAGYLGVGTHGVVLEPDTLAFPDPAPTSARHKSRTRCSLPSERPARNIASSAFCQSSAISFLSPSTACSFIFRIMARRYPFRVERRIRLTPTASTSTKPRRSEQGSHSWIVVS